MIILVNMILSPFSIISIAISLILPSFSVAMPLNPVISSFSNGWTSLIKVFIASSLFPSSHSAST